MGVEVIGMQGEIDGYGDSMEAFRNAHESNTGILLNLLDGKKKNAPRKAYDPDHPDNQWPAMVYHPARGELVVGKSLVGLSDTPRKQVEAANKAALDAALKAGYRREPYLKPQIAVLDPAAEKKALLDKNQELEGKIVAQADIISKMGTLLDKLADKAGISGNS